MRVIDTVLVPMILTLMIIGAVVFGIVLEKTINADAEPCVIPFEVVVNENTTVHYLGCDETTISFEIKGPSVDIYIE